MSGYVTVTGANFETEVLDSPVPVLLDFWASWCGPCRMISPIIEQLAEEYAYRLKVGKVNVDEEGDLAGRHGVVSIPTLLVYKNGEIKKQAAGALPKRNIEALFKDLLAD
jgi:thioredoxin 1